ncbi:hypothetical protein M9978_16620 [Sphingomonas sp. MG17]|uniref:Uncharacterized protein n=1 Tax=Sphingomonas tagetis TaxID=2949092 RepID=A0A9X2HSY5_9SPHN|nr:hypothetical protein [Sphingomonas tagetis]MCP3732050.1 hypothetical protein [Sphingomonas tagetis]
MTQPLNYTPKAIADLSAMAAVAEHTAPMTAIGLRYLVDKLRSAQVFVLFDSGQLLDRSKPRPELPGLVLRPPFPVVALEYASASHEWGDSVYTMSKCSKRISLAWDHKDDLPPFAERIMGGPLPPGVIIASIPFYDSEGAWMPTAVAMHVEYDGDWIAQQRDSNFRREMMAAGRMTKAVAESRTLPGTAVPMSPETCIAAISTVGGAQAMDMLAADVMDEAAAYMDLCWALACKNISASEHPAPANLNRARVRKGKEPLKPFHVLELAGNAVGTGDGTGSISSRRAHLRRGHIRRLGPDRVTWVNQTMVHGRGAGFVEKIYSIGGRRA